MRKLIGFLHEIGTIMYVGGILSHIVIGILFAHSDPETTITVYTYKLQSAYILILPGLGLKIVTDLVLWFVYGERAWWMRIKLACTAFLTVNAFVFLVPMMPELLALAEASVPAGELSEAFLTLEGREQLVGMSNVIPLLTEMVMGAFRPNITRHERAQV
ncbi:MAG: enoyl-CoA hydratase [Pseudomonadota bacterium]